jgi:hypothetical protein
VKRAVLALFLIAPAAFGATRTWVGVLDLKWSTPVNWEGGPPSSGDDVVMRSIAWTTNDLPAGLQLRSLTVVDGTRISGNDVVLGAGGLSSTGPLAPGKGTVVGFSSITLAESQTWTNPAGINFFEVGPTDLNGKTLTMEMAPSAFIKSLQGGGALVQARGTTYLGSSSDSRNSVIVNGGWLSIYEGGLGPAQVNSGTLELWHVALRDVKVNGGTTLYLSDKAFTGNLTFADSTQSAANLGVPVDEHFQSGIGNVRFAASIEVGGAVILANAMLQLHFYSNHISGFDPFVIINNQTTAPVSGTFLGIPDGAIVNNPHWQSFRVSYTGGDGNDVTLTPADHFYSDSTTAVTTSANPARGSVTLTATVTPAAARGNVSFYDGSVFLGSAPIDGAGRATLAAKLLDGTHTIAAAYTGSTTYATSFGTLKQTIGPVRGRVVGR